MSCHSLYFGNILWGSVNKLSQKNCCQVEQRCQLLREEPRTFKQTKINNFSRRGVKMDQRMSLIFFAVPPCVVFCRLGVQTLGSTRFPGIMTSLVTSTNLVPLESFTNCHMTSETLTGNRRGTKEKRRIMGIGTFVIDRPFDKHLKFRKNLQDFQEQHRGVAKSQVRWWQHT